MQAPLPRSLSPAPFPHCAFAPERAELGLLLGAGQALAPDGLDECVEIIAAIVVRDLVVGFDALDRPNLDHVLHEIDFRIWPALMVDIARPVSPAGAVDRPAIVDLEQIPRIEILGVVGVNLPADISNDELALFDRYASEQAEPGLGSADAKVARW